MQSNSFISKYISHFSFVKQLGKRILLLYDNIIQIQTNSRKLNSISNMIFTFMRASSLLSFVISCLQHCVLSYVCVFYVSSSSSSSWDTNNFGIFTRVFPKQQKCTIHFFSFNLLFIFQLLFVSWKRSIPCSRFAVKFSQFSQT